MSKARVRKADASQFTQEDVDRIKGRFAEALSTGRISTIEWVVDEYGDIVSVLDQQGETVYGFGRSEGQYHLIDGSSASVIATSCNLSKVLEAVPAA